MRQTHTPAALARPAAGTAGTWLLPPRQAMTLQPAHDGVLRVARGELWATFDGPHPGPANGRGDRFLQAGDSLELRSGERLVIEPTQTATAARFTWDALPSLHGSDGVRHVAVRLMLIALASILTAGIWFGFAAESSAHRSDAIAASGAPKRITLPSIVVVGHRERSEPDASSATTVARTTGAGGGATAH